MITLREFNEILNNEFNKFYNKKNIHIQKQKNIEDFECKINVPFIQSKKYCIGSPLYFIGTNNKYLLGIICKDKFKTHFVLEKMTPYLDEEVEVAIASMLINDHKESISKIESLNIEEKTRWQGELDWHKSEIDKLQCVVDKLQENKDIEIEI